MRTTPTIATGLVLTALAAAGCDQTTKADNALLRQENEQLRHELAAKSPATGITEQRTTQRPLGTAASAAPMPAPLAAPQTYVIKAGDTLTGISQSIYGTVRHWKLIYDANRDVIGNDFNRLKIGSKLTIPVVAADGK